MTINVIGGTTTTLATSVNSSVIGQTVTLTASVTSSGGTPTGTVTFYDGGVAIGTGTLDGSGNATFAYSGLSVGSHDLTASYAGDANFFSGSTTGAATAFSVAALQTRNATFTAAASTTLYVSAASGLLQYNNDPYLSLQVTAINGGNTGIGSTITTAAGGSLTVNADGSFAYTPPSGFTGADTFNYTISDGNGNISTATVTINVNPLGGFTVTVGLG